MYDDDNDEELRLARLRYAAVADQNEALTAELLARQPTIQGLALIEPRTEAEELEFNHLVGLNSRDIPRVESSNRRMAEAADAVHVAEGGVDGRYTSELAVLQAGADRRNNQRLREALERVQRED